MEYKEIIRNAAGRKLLDLAKYCLDIVDELRKEDVTKIENFLSAAEENGFGQQARALKPFLFLIDNNKKEIIRKRILDKTNELVRELEQ